MTYEKVKNFTILHKKKIFLPYDDNIYHKKYYCLPYDRTTGEFGPSVGVGGLRDVEKEPVHPDDISVKIKRKIKLKGVESTRRSDRQLREDIDIEKIEFGVKSRSLKALGKGGNGGRIIPCDEKELNYLPSIGLHSHLQKKT